MIESDNETRDGPRKKGSRCTTRVEMSTESSKPKPPGNQETKGTGRNLLDSILVDKAHRQGPQTRFRRLGHLATGRKIDSYTYIFFKLYIIPSLSRKAVDGKNGHHCIHVR